MAPFGPIAPTGPRSPICPENYNHDYLKILYLLYCICYVCVKKSKCENKSIQNFWKDCNKPKKFYH